MHNSNNRKIALAKVIIPAFVSTGLSIIFALIKRLKAQPIAWCDERIDSAYRLPTQSRFDRHQPDDLATLSSERQ
jgi:hypothetical protein